MSGDFYTHQDVPLNGSVHIQLVPDPLNWSPNSRNTFFSDSTNQNGPITYTHQHVSHLPIGSRDKGCSESNWWPMEKVGGRTFLKPFTHLQTNQLQIDFSSKGNCQIARCICNYRWAPDTFKATYTFGEAPFLSPSPDSPLEIFQKYDHRLTIRSTWPTPTCPPTPPRQVSNSICQQIPTQACQPPHPWLGSARFHQNLGRHQR